MKGLGGAHKDHIGSLRTSSTIGVERHLMNSAPDAAQQEFCEPGSTLLCMGSFSRFLVQAPPCAAEGTQCRVRDTRSLAPRAYGTNRSNSNTSCSNRPRLSCAAASARSAPGRPRSWMPIDGLPAPADRECRVALVRGQSSG